MALTTYSELWRALRLHVPIAPVELCKQFIISRFRDVHRKRLWSWRVSESQFLIPASYSTGTVAVTHNSATVNGTNTVWTASMVGRQFRVGAVAPVYTIIAVNSATQLVLDDEWGGATATGVGYLIWQGYVTPPSDFHDFISVRDVAYNWQLHLHMSQQWINTVDAQRSFSGNPYAIVDYRYSTTPTAGSIRPISQVVGSGDAPVAGGLYTGRTESNFVITVTTGGAVGTAIFSWRKGDGSTASGVVSTEAPYTLQEGVTIQWPSGLTFVLSDVFVITVTPGFTAGIPMYELWPYQFAQSVYPYLYDRMMPDLDDPNGTLPRYIQGDVLVKGALADLARWPGTADHENPLYNLNTSKSYEQEFQYKVAEMERQDDEVYETNINDYLNLPWAPAPWADSAWMQSHDTAALLYY